MTLLAKAYAMSVGTGVTPVVVSAGFEAQVGVQFTVGLTATTDDDDDAKNLQCSVGMFTATEQFCNALYAQDATGALTRYTSSASRCLLEMATTATTIGELTAAVGATDVTFTPSGLTGLTGFAQDYRVFGLLLGGDGVENVGDMIDVAEPASPGDVTIEDVPFSPNLWLIMKSTVDQFQVGLGIASLAADGTTIVNGHSGAKSYGFSDGNTLQGRDEFSFVAIGGGSGVQTRGAFTSFTSDGGVITFTEAGGLNTFKVLPLRIKDAAVLLTQHTSATSATVTPISTPFEPVAAMQLCIGDGECATDAVQTHYGFGMGFWDGTDQFSQFGEIQGGNPNVCLAIEHDAFQVTVENGASSAGGRITIDGDEDSVSLTQATSDYDANFGLVLIVGQLAAVEGGPSRSMMGIGL